MEMNFEQKAAAVLEGMEQDRQKLLMRQPFIGLILMNLQLVPLPGDVLKTAATDGARVFMSIPFYASLDAEERLFVLAHEAWHCVLMHLMRCQKRHHKKFGCAADLEIHFILQKEKMKEPFVPPHNPEWEGLSAEEIYEKLDYDPQDTSSLEKTVESTWNPGRTSKHLCASDGYGFDELVFAEQPIPGLPQDSDLGQSPRWDDRVVEQVRRNVIRAAQIVERRQGHLPDHIMDLVAKIRKPELPWQELLRQYVTSCYGGARRWLPPERRHVSRGLYLPSYHDHRLNAVLAIDTSGSTTGNQPQFFAELSNLLNSFGLYDITVIQCDDAIRHVELFTEARRLPRDYQWQSFGQGGTSFIPVFDYLQKQRRRPDIFIYLTDGYGDAPVNPPRYPVLWVLTDDGRQPAPWGRCLKLQ